MNRLYVYVLPVFAYLIGAVPWGFVLTRRFCRDDIRKAGSGNIGATNVRRVAGNRLAVATLSADMLKGAIPVLLALMAPEVDPSWTDPYASLVALLAFLGHLYPIYFGLKGGGKGVATAAGCFLVLAPPAAVAACLIFALFVRITNRVSVGSLAGAAALPVAVWIDTGAHAVTACALAVSGMIFVRHRENIRRLLSGNEPYFGQSEDNK